VSFRWRDYRHGNAPGIMTLESLEFIRRLLLHSLPDGFHRKRFAKHQRNGSQRIVIAKRFSTRTVCVIRTQTNVASLSVRLHAQYPET
jgi:hypothetical protein